MVSAEIALYFWLLAVLCPPGMREFRFGSCTGEAREYPTVSEYPVSFCPPLNNAMYELRDTLG